MLSFALAADLVVELQNGTNCATRWSRVPMMAGYRGLKGLPDAINTVWELAVVQTLSVHNSEVGTVPPATCTVAGRTHADTHPSRTPCRPVPPRRKQTVNQPAGAATSAVVIAEISFWRGMPTQPVNHRWCIRKKGHRPWLIFETPKKPASSPESNWGGSFHQLCLVDADGKTIFQKRFHHTVADLEQLQEATTKHPGNVRFAIERSEGLLVERLQQLRIEIYCVSPKISARARERYWLATKKSDAFDAFVLADMLRHEHAHWRPLSTPSALLARIRALSRDREQCAKTPHWTGALYETARAAG
jgi:hypothetical protein